VGASRTGENVDIADVGRDGACFATREAFRCAAMVSLSDCRLPAALTFGAAAGPTLTVNADADAVLPAFGLDESFSKSCLLLASRLAMILALINNVFMLTSILDLRFTLVRPRLRKHPVS
jgi:hypothetical protein